jgi:Ca2+-transporting ATPase
VVAVLFVAGLLSFAIGERGDAVVILAVLALNGGLGFLQEHRAERALAALRRLEAEHATVRRDGRRQVVEAATLVPGDVILLEAGERVPADVRLVSASSLQTVEAALTGESAFVEKDPGAALDASAVLPERVTMAYAGTTIASGVAEGIVVATGRTTELGHIATLVGQVPREPTPLQRELSTLGNRLVAATGAVVVLLFLLGLLRGVPVSEMFTASVGLAVAAVPEGLPAVVTVALAVAVRRLARRHVLIRRLGAVETLGSTSVICVDKTGTLTTGRMEVRVVATLDGRVAVDRLSDTRGPAAESLHAAACCTTATLVSTAGGHEVRGDPMEGALLLAAQRAGVPACSDQPLRTYPFHARRKRMSVLRREGAGAVLYVKGAPESVLPLCSHAFSGRGIVPLDANLRTRLEALNHEMSGEGLRVLATASRSFAASEAVDEDVERGLTFLGHVGFQDPPRMDTAPAVEQCRRAGIRPVMITGDQAGTALAVARSLGIASSAEEVATGAQLELLPAPDLAALAARTAVYARTSPADKLRIVRALQQAGAVVAMTGDGVNDTPALKGADIGVAMGSGTEAAKDVAAMVVTDDRFASIVVAVAEGRTVHENVRKSLLYLLSGNVGELLVIATALAAGWPLPLLPAQILWVNLVTDALPALALAVDPGEPDVLDRPARARTRGLTDARFAREVVEIGVLTAACTLAAFLIGLEEGPEGRARTMAFSTLVVAEVLLSFVVRSRTRIIWQLGLASNVRLLLVGIGTLGLQILLLAQPVIGRWLGVVPLAFHDLAVVGALGLLPATIIEVRKLVRAAASRTDARR